MMVMIKVMTNDGDDGDDDDFDDDDEMQTIPELLQLRFGQCTHRDHWRFPRSDDVGDNHDDIYIDEDDNDVDDDDRWQRLS